MNYRIRIGRRVVGLAMLLTGAVMSTGCSPTQPFFFFENDKDLSHYVGMATNIEYPDVKTCSLQEVDSPPPPLTISNAKFDEAWDLCLADAVKIALENGKVMKTLGVRTFSTPNIARTNVGAPVESLVDQPAAAITVYEPALFETDPIFGPEGALSAFDTQFVASAFWDKHDEPENIQPGALGFGQPQVFQQDLGTFQEGFTKTAVTGAELTAFSNTQYNSNNNVSNLEPSAWSQNFELGIKQPLLQGAGQLYNRIAGPFDPLRGIGTYLQYDGVVIARIRTDIRLADFEAGVRNFVSDVENAYWELYFAYRNLEATKSGRDAALQTWRKVRAKYDTGTLGGEKDKEAQAREQYFLFRASLETALSDLFKAENRLRYMMGIAATDGRMIRPCDEPTDAKVTFDWCEVHSEAMARSVELRQQKWRIKQREMELIASKNLLLPRLDVTGKYRFLGLGQDLVRYPGQVYNPTVAADSSLAGSNAFSSIASGDFQEWEVGANFSMPIGFRQPLAAVRNAQLNLARERSLLQDQELEQSHLMADAIRDIDTDYTLAQTNFNRRVAAQQQVEAVQALYEVGAGGVTLDLVLEAQRTRADAEAAYYRSLVDYNKAIMMVHFRKGSLLEYNGVFLAEGPWPAKAYFDAKRRARERDAGLYLDYGFTRPEVFSQGPYPQFQNTDGTSGHVEGAPTQAMPEEVHPPMPQRSMPGNQPNGNQMELPAPAPMGGPAAAVRNQRTPTANSNNGGGRHYAASQQQSGQNRASAPANDYDDRAANLAKWSQGVRQTNYDRSAPDGRNVNSGVTDSQVHPAGGLDSFDWGDLSLSAPTGKSNNTPAPAAANTRGGQWISSGANDSDPSQSAATNDQSAAGWKRAQR